jgi:hypothetical protein
MRVHRSMLLVAFLSPLLAGCVTDQVRALGAAELQCPSNEVDVVGGSGSYVARGCGKTVVFDCFEAPASQHHVSCYPRSGLGVRPDPAAAASLPNRAEGSARDERD